MNRAVWCLAALFLSACASTGTLPRHAAANDIYRRYVAAPAARSARVAWCGKVARRSIAGNFSTEGSMEKSSMAEEQLLAKQLDCRFLGAFHAELRYAAVNRVLGPGAWRSCLRIAPVGRMTTAPELGIYLQCLRMINGAEACQAGKSDTRPYSVSGSGAACEQVLAWNDWSQSGEPQWSARPRSLFERDDARSARPPPNGKTALRLPTSVALRGRIHTGFYLNCCTFDVGYVMPYAYLRLARAVRVSDWFLGTTSVRDIQLDRSVAGSEIDTPVKVSCARLASGETAHYALSAYCWGARIHPLESSRRGVD